MANLAEQASKLLDFDQKLDITLLDSIVGCMYAGAGEQVVLKKVFYILLISWINMTFTFNYLTFAFDENHECILMPVIGYCSNG